MVLSPGGNIGVFVVFLVVDVFVCAARLWSCWLKKRSLRLDDYLVMFATLMGVAYSAVEFYAIEDAGSGQSAASLGPDATEKLTLETKLTNVSGPLWAFGSAAFKLSILALLYDIFAVKLFRRVTIGIMALTVAWLIGMLLAVWLICRPLAKEWNPSLPGECGNEQQLIMAYAVSPMILDTIIMILPLPVLWRLQMPTKRKIGLTIVFGLSFCAVATNAVRTGITVGYSADADLTLENQLQGIMQALEITLGIIIASAPTLQPASATILRCMRSAVGLSNPSSRQRAAGSSYQQMDKLRELQHSTDRDEIPLQQMLAGGRSKGSSSSVNPPDVFEYHTKGGSKMV